MADVMISFGAALEQLVEGVEGAKSAIEGFKANVEKVAELATLGFGTEKIAEFVSEMGELGEHVERTAAILGVSTRSVQELGFIARATGGDSESLALSMERLQVNLQKAQGGAGPAAAALQALGLRAKDLIGLPLDEQMNRIADAVSKFADGGNKTAIVMELLGRGGAQMIPVLDQGREGLDNLRQSADAAGIVLTSHTIEALGRVQRSVVTTKSELTSLGAVLVGEFAGQIGAASRSIAAFATDMTALITTGQFGEYVMIQLNGAFASIAETIKMVGNLLVDLAHLDFSAIADDWVKGNKKADDAMKDMVADLAVLKFKAKSEMEDLLKETSGEGATIKPQAPAMANLGGGSSAALQGFQEQIRLVDQQFAAMQEHLNAEVKLNEVTEARKTQILLAELDKRKAAEDAILDKESQVGGLSVAEAQRIANQKLQIDQKYAADRQKIMDQAAEAEQKKWNEVGSTIASAFNSQTKALLAGTETFGEAMKNIFADMVVKIVNELEKIVIEDYIIKGVQVALFGPAGALPSFDVGTDYVASSGLAMVHAGETIVPAQGTGPYTGGGAAGGSNVVFAPNFSGFIGTQAMLNQIMPQLARMLSDYQGRNPSLS
jgi:hypothetical protein